VRGLAPAVGFTYFGLYCLGAISQKTTDATKATLNISKGINHELFSIILVILNSSPQIIALTVSTITNAEVKTYQYFNCIFLYICKYK
jgi:hypothetical protein